MMIRQFHFEVSEKISSYSKIKKELERERDRWIDRNRRLWIKLSFFFINQHCLKPPYILE